MKITLTLLLILSATALFAQQKTVVSHDTINIHGYIYDNTGKGINFLHIESKQLDPEHNTFKVAAYTNDRGYFELKGAKYNDTLSIGPDVHYGLIQYYNQGSRLLMIYLPPAKILDVTLAAPFIVSQKRKYPKVTPSFTVTTVENKPAGPIDIDDPKYPGGNSQFETFIKENIQYPESALKGNMEGIVQISFTITKEGYHKDYKILRGVSDACDAEAMRVLKKMPNWDPAIDHGQPVPMQAIVSIQFKLTDN